MGLTGEGLSDDDLWDLGGRENVAEHLREVADGRLADRETEVGEADWGQVERIVLLRTIDSLWVEHLTELDDMRRGIGLRGYAQQDPLNEFRREAFRLYEELRSLIRHGVASSIFRVTVQKQPPPDAGLSQALAQGAEAHPGRGGRDRQRRRRHVRAPRAAAAAAAASTTAAAGSAVLRGAVPAAPSVRNVQESLGDAPVAPSTAGGGNGAGAAGGRAAGLHADRRAHRAQRSVLVRVRPEVQEVPREVTGRCSALARVARAHLSSSARGYAASGSGPGSATSDAQPGHRRHGRRPIRRPPVPGIAARRDHALDAFTRVAPRLS